MMAVVYHIQEPTTWMSMLTYPVQSAQLWPLRRPVLTRRISSVMILWTHCFRYAAPGVLPLLLQLTWPYIQKWVLASQQPSDAAANDMASADEQSDGSDDEFAAGASSAAQRKDPRTRARPAAAVKPKRSKAKRGSKASGDAAVLPEGALMTQVHDCLAMLCSLVSSFPLKRHTDSMIALIETCVEVTRTQVGKQRSALE